MKITIIYFLLFLNLVAGPDLEKLADLVHSSIWQVRYGVVLEFEHATPESRRALEILAKDKHHMVARHAFSVYSRVFLELDEAAVEYAFERGDFDYRQIGYLRTSKRDGQTSDFWINHLESDSNPTNDSRTIEIIGLVGNPKAFPALKKYETSQNAGVLQRLGVAYFRLGQAQKYKEVLISIFELPMGEALYYYTTTIDYLIQSHPELAIELWSKVNVEILKGTEIQPGWVYMHIIQEQRLPTHASEKPNKSIEEQPIQPPRD